MPTTVTIPADLAPILARLDSLEARVEALEAGEIAPIPPHPGPGVVMAYWHWSWDGAVTLQWMMDHRPAVSGLYYAQAVSDNNNSGNLHMDGACDADDIAAWLASGRHCWLMVGGQPGNGNGFQCQTSGQADQAFASIVRIVDQYHFGGVTWDLEGDAAQYDPAQLAAVSRRLKEYYGMDFGIAFDPQPYRIRDANSGVSRCVAMLLPDGVDRLNVQWYDQPGQGDQWFINQYILADLHTIIVTHGIPAAKVMMGCSQSGGPPGDGATYADAWRQAVALYPTLGGASFWEDRDDPGSSWYNAMVPAMGL